MAFQPLPSMKPALVCVLTVFVLLFVVNSNLDPLVKNFKIKYVPKIYNVNRQHSKTEKGNFSTDLMLTAGPKLVLFYTPFFGDKPWSANIFEKSNCGSAIKKCVITYDNNLYTESDVVIFHGRDMPSYVGLSQLNQQRKRGQLWLYFIMESLLNTPDMVGIAKFFNLTSSYRVDSDVQIPYRYHFRADSEPTDRDYFEGKTEDVLWLVSNCETKRETLARKLIEYGVKMNVAGGCSSHFPQNIFTCSSRECSEISKFKFYFSAENSLCKDYITEKYWDRVLKDVIPIVFGGSNYSDERLAIPGSFIDAMTFPSPKSLAEYILKVSVNRTLYNSYFAWKNKWTFRGSDYYTCELCKFFSNPTNKSIFSVEPFKSEECSEPLQKYYEWIDK